MNWPACTARIPSSPGVSAHRRTSSQPGHCCQAPWKSLWKVLKLLPWPTCLLDLMQNFFQNPSFQSHLEKTRAFHIYICCFLYKMISEIRFTPKGGLLGTKDTIQRKTQRGVYKYPKEKQYFCPENNVSQEDSLKGDDNTYLAVETLVCLL